MIDIEKRNFEGITLIESWPVEKNHAYCSPEAYKFIGGMVDELQAAREKIAEQGGLISRQGIEIMNQLEEIARQAEELELLRAVFHEDYGDGGERLRYVEWLEKHRPEGIFQGNTPTSYKEWCAKQEKRDE